MGSFFGDGAKRESSSSNVSTTTTTTTNTDNRMVNDGASVGINGSGNTVLDNGAIGMAFDFSRGSTESAFKSTADAMGILKDGMKLTFDQQAVNGKGFLDAMGKLLDTAKTVNENATANVKEAYSNVQEISTGQKFLVAGGLVLAGIVAVSKIKG